MIKNKFGFIAGITLAAFSLMGNMLHTIYFPEKVYLSIIGYVLIGLGTAIAIFSAIKDSNNK